MTDQITTPEVVTENELERKAFYQRKRILVPAFLTIIAIFFIAKMSIHSMLYVSTDDAFIEGHTVAIAPKVSGNILNVYIDDNQAVKKGQLLAEIDPKDYQVKYEQAEAKLEAAVERQDAATTNSNLTSITSSANFSQANAGIASAKSQVDFAQKDFNRVDKLYARGIVSKQDFDRASTTLQVAQKNLEQAMEKQKSADTVTEQIKISDSQVRVSKAEIKQLKAAAKQAELDLSYTKIYAPQDGKVTGKSVEVGAFVQTGQPLLALIPNKRWIVANFKETQLTNMKAGQAVEIKIDTYPNKVFKGKVDSIQSATGSKASLFPPENAVGSFVKVVQRVPVKIVFTEGNISEYNIVPGMSVIPEVRVK